MLLLLFLGSTVVSFCSNLSYSYDCTNVVDAGKRHRLQGRKLFGNYLLASLIYDNRGTPQFGIQSCRDLLLIQICNIHSVGHDKQMCPPTVFEKRKFLPTWICPDLSDGSFTYESQQQEQP